MKKLTLLFLTILFFATYALQAQKSFSGEIVFETRLDGTDDPNLLSSSESQTITVLILGNKSMSVIKFEGIALTQVWDGDKGTSLTLVEITGMGKFYQKRNAEQHKEKLKFSEFDFSYEDDFKEILSYKCQKVVVTTTNLEDDSQTETILYVTKEIGSAKLNGDDLPGLDGFPLMYITPIDQYCDGCAQVMEAIKIAPKKLKDVDFLLPSDAKNIEEDPETKGMFKGSGLFGE